MNFFFSRQVIAPRKGSIIAGGLYWVFSLLGLGLVMRLILELLGVSTQSPEGYVRLNLLIFTVEFIAILLIFRSFLYRSVKGLRGNMLRCLTSVLLAYALSSILVSQLDVMYRLFELRPDNYNDEAVNSLLELAPVPMFICTVFFAPITEECLYRGILFGALVKKVPVLAYVLSCLVFSAMHVLGSIGVADVQNILLCFFQYVPVSVALCWAYHRSGNIFAPILFHMLNNFMAVTASYVS